MNSRLDFYIDEQNTPENVFFCIRSKSEISDAKGSCGSYSKIDMERINPTDEEIEIFVRIADTFGVADENIGFFIYSFEGM